MCYEEAVYHGGKLVRKALRRVGEFLRALARKDFYSGIRPGYCPCTGRLSDCHDGNSDLHGLVGIREESLGT